jgi:hypothetical protein
MRGNGKLTADEFIDYVFGTEVSGSQKKLLRDLAENGKSKHHILCGSVSLIDHFVSVVLKWQSWKGWKTPRRNVFVLPYFGWGLWKGW